MEQYAIKGGNPLVGEVEIGGAKNAALPILAASVMTDETVYIENMPDVRDTNVLLCAMENIGVIVKRTDRHKVTLNASNISELVVEDENIKKIRASYYLIGALLGKYKHAEVALPGGCDIGCRAIDQHIKGFRALGAEVKIEHGLIKTHAGDHGAAYAPDRQCESCHGRAGNRAQSISHPRRYRWRQTVLHGTALSEPVHRRRKLSRQI